MRDNKLLLIALVWSIVGIFILILAANYAEPPQLEISGLESKLGKIVLVSAQVKSVRYSDDAAFLNLADETGEIFAVFFEKPKYEIIEGDAVLVKGKVQMYKGEPELVIQELACSTCS